MIDLMRELLTIDAGREKTSFDNVKVLLECIRQRELYPLFLTIDGGVNEPEFQAEGQGRRAPGRRPHCD